MTDTTERKYTLAEVRAAVVGALVNEGYTEGEAMERAKYAHPDPLPPEPERRWVRMWDGKDAARDPDGTWWVRRGDRVACQSGATDAHIIALYDLVPRVPVTVTEEIHKKARMAWDSVVRESTGNSVNAALRAALSAVAADLAQPVHACQHKAQLERLGKFEALVKRARIHEEAEYASSAHYRHAASEIVNALAMLEEAPDA